MKYVKIKILQKNTQKYGNLVSIRIKILDWEGLKGRGLTGDLEGKT